MIIGFTGSLAIELGPDDVTVNAIAPGLVSTAGAREAEPPEVFEAMIEQQSIKRQERPEDIAAAVVFLASDDAAFITGQTLSVDSGLARR